MNKRRDMDIVKLMMSEYKVNLNNGLMNDIIAQFNGPQDSLYEGGILNSTNMLPTIRDRAQRFRSGD